MVTLEKQHFAIRMQVTSTHNLESWTLVVVYGPCRQLVRDLFVDWFYHLNIDDDDV
jgi:hypothetical protein